MQSLWLRNSWSFLSHIPFPSLLIVSGPGHNTIMIVSKQLIANCQNSTERKAWLTNLPRMLKDLTLRWALHLAAPFDQAGIDQSRDEESPAAIYPPGMWTGNQFLPISAILPSRRTTSA